MEKEKILNGLVENIIVKMHEEKTLEYIERQHILRILGENRGNRIRSAKILRIGIRTLQRKIKAYMSKGINVPPSVR